MATVIIIGSGFDLDLGLQNSFQEYNNYRLNLTYGDKKWSNLEEAYRNEVIKWYKSGKDEQEAIRINIFWQAHTLHLSYFLTEKSDSFCLNKNSCAYRLLQALTNRSRTYTFNYTNPYDYVDVIPVYEFTHLHGEYFRDTFANNKAVMSQNMNLIIGIDKNCIPEDGINHAYIRPMVKEYHISYKETDIISSLDSAEVVIFFGFSMGIVDYVYFDKFFSSVIDGDNNCKMVYYVTWDNNSYRGFIQNISRFGVDLDKLNRQVSIVPIYTNQGPDNKKFVDMLEFV